MLTNLKLLRQERGLSQQRLAELIGVSQQAVYKYERLSVEPDIATLIKVWDLFEVSVDYLVGNTTERRKNQTSCQCDLTQNEMRHIQLYRQAPCGLREHIDGILNEFNKK